MKKTIIVLLTAFASLLAISCGEEEIANEVVSITLNKPELALKEGESATLTATITPSAVTALTVTWESDNPAVASVDQNGKVTAVAEGSATVKASCGGKSAICKVTVSKLVVAVESVTLSSYSLTLKEGESKTLTATVHPDNATEASVSWESDDTAVATVDQSGKVTAVAEGVATITASCGGKSAACEVTVETDIVYVDVESVTINPSALTLTEGESATLTATVNPANATEQTVSWSSSNSAVATVSQSGKVTAVAEGTATITAACGGKSATCAVTVSKLVIPVESVTLSKTVLTLTEGESETLTATVNPTNATEQTVSWTSGNSAVATVDQSGKVTAVAEGTATITASCGGQSATCAVTVSKLVIPVESVTLGKTALTLTEGESETLSATVNPSNATEQTVVWSSSTSAVATVDQTGLVTAVAEGTATITASCGGKSATCEITVSKRVIPVESIILSKTSLTLTEGESETLTATVNPTNATEQTVVWSSNNSAVATVDQNGKVTAISEGVAIITASCGGKYAVCDVTVNEIVIPVESVTLSKTELALTEGEYETLTATVNPSNATDQTVVWSTSNSAVATVDQSGIVTAVAEGTATITASCGGKSATCAVTVASATVYSSMEDFEYEDFTF